MLAILLTVASAFAQNGTWSGGTHQDPLTNLVDWSTVVDSSICWAGADPIGWDKALYRTVIHNNTEQPLRLNVDGGQVDVVDSPVAGGLALPYMAIAKTSRGTERFTVLMPGQKCFMVLPQKSNKAAATTGWTVHATMLAYAGSAGDFLPAGSAYLNTVPLFEAGDEIDEVKWRTQAYTLVRFDRDEF